MAELYSPLLLGAAAPSGKLHLFLPSTSTLSTMLHRRTAEERSNVAKGGDDDLDDRKEALCGKIKGR
jgi:hypothetical protein